MSPNQKSSKSPAQCAIKHGGASYVYCGAHGTAAEPFFEMIFFGTSDFHFLTTSMMKNHLSLGDIFGCGECIVSVRQSKEGRGPTALVSSLISIRIIIFPFVHRHCIVVEIAHFRRLLSTIIDV
jgi:hypothetical protein